jgi:hypothetical protein
MNDSDYASQSEGEKQRIDRELIEFLNELRVVLPGVQVLSAFLLAMPFQSAFAKLGALELRLYFACFLCSTAASAILIAPSLYHRLHWRRDVRDKEAMLRTFNRLAILGATLLGVAMIMTIFLISHFLFGLETASAAAAAAVLLVGYLWYVLPLARRQRDRAVGNSRD